MGRPPGPVENLRRNRATVMLTDTEFAVLQRLAASDGVPIGTALHGLVSRALRRK